MKIIIFFCLILTLGVSCRKDEQPHMITCESEINSFSQNYFALDAIELTLDKTNEDSLSPFHNSPDIDGTLAHYILGKLSVIYNAAVDSIPEFYDIIYKYKIHSRPKWTYNDLSIKFNDTVLENEFVANPGNTSCPELNDLTNVYGFTGTYLLYGFYHLHSTNFYNIPVLCDKLKSDIRIEYASPNYFCCDGDDILYSQAPMYDEFIFDFGMGDCPSGCFGHHFWRVRVDKDCTVSLTEEFGDPLPG